MEKIWEIIRYEPGLREEWDAFVSESRQGTLLHRRGYMDYHADRFKDSSLMALRGGKPAALLPANITADGTLHSHQGLTYGGWLTPRKHFNANDMLELFDVWLEWCRQEGIGRIVYKPVPSIYHRIPADEDLYALFRHDAKLIAMNLSSAIDLSNPTGFNTQQKRNLKRAAALNPWVRETQDAGEFMALVAGCLMERHGATPVHTAAEMQTLHDRFPGEIKMWLCGSGDAPEAGVCIYDTAGVAHCQYIATTPEGREQGMLTYLMERLINDVYASRRWFDLGTSNEEAGRVLNSGLIRQKTSLGASGIAYAGWELGMRNEE